MLRSPLFHNIEEYQMWVYLAKSVNEAAVWCMCYDESVYVQMAGSHLRQHITSWLGSPQRKRYNSRALILTHYRCIDHAFCQKSRRAGDILI